MVTGPNDVDEIYRRMAVIRHEHHTNVRESVAGAEAVVDWGRYTWTYPWIALGAAAAVGYMVYASGHRKVVTDTTRLADGAKADELAAGARTKGGERWRTGRNLLLGAWTILFPVAVRAGQNYMVHCLEQQYRSRTAGPARPLTAGRGAGRPDRPGEAVGD
ncbi:MAG: hypothetical protein P4L84_25955 [Isosphaeraceae bacterium]|nr:hypothetical protein [Isosphaeraceae bacterium]